MKPDPKRDALLQELHERLKVLYGERLDQLVLYGSHARGENHPDSDLDVMVVLNGDVESVFEEIRRLVDVTFELDLKYNEYISVLPVPKGDFMYKQSPLLMNVRREGVPIEEAVDEQR